MAGILCPSCSGRTRVVRSEPEAGVVMRVRECRRAGCSGRVVTFERVESATCDAAVVTYIAEAENLLNLARRRLSGR